MAMAERSGGDLAGFAARYASIARRLDGPEGEATAADREAVRGEIVGLFREVETAIEELTAFKERIRELVARYKALPAPD
jgi:hypothetical protein